MHGIFDFSPEESADETGSISKLSLHVVKQIHLGRQLIYVVQERLLQFHVYAANRGHIQ